VSSVIKLCMDGLDIKSLIILYFVTLIYSLHINEIIMSIENINSLDFVSTFIFCIVNCSHNDLLT